MNESGASVIIGTLVLILVVVIGAASIGLMMSTAQKEEMNRQAHQNAVKNENLDIERIVLVNATNTSLSDRWAFVNFTIVNLDINDATVTIVGLYDQNNKTYLYPQNITAGSFPSTLSVYEGQFGRSTPRYSDPQGNMLHIPGKKSVDVSIDLTNFSDSNPRMFLRSGDEIRLIIYTLLLNNFEERFIPPDPRVRVSVESEDIGVSRDYVVLDGSDSTDDGSIVEYRWDIWFNGTGYPYPPKVGKKITFKPESNHELNVTLTVTDNTGMQTTSDIVRIPPNNQFFPPVRIDIAVDGLAVNATVTDLSGMPVKGIAVSFIGTNVTFASSPYSLTDCYGNAVTSVNSSGGTIKAVAADYNLQSLTATV